jgi:uncharacterized protein
MVMMSIMDQPPTETDRPSTQTPRAPAPAPAPRDGDWPAWAAPLALAFGFVLAAVGALIVDIPAALFGVNVSASKTPPGLEIADTVVQDIGFVVAAVMCARIGGRRVRAWQFGLRPTRAQRAVSGVILTFLATLAFTAIWAQLLKVSTKEHLLEQLGTHEASSLLVLSAALTTVIAPICEEMLFRGFIFSALRKWSGVLPGALITGLLFGAVHIGSAPAVDLVPLGVLGFALCLLYNATKSLYPCIATHSINNSIAFGSLEGWGWQTAVLLLASLAAIGLIAKLLRSAGVISPEPPRPPLVPEGA